MEEKKRMLLAVLISAIILLAVLYSFGLNLFNDPPEIVVAPPEGSAPVSDSPGPESGGGIPVGVTPETVQAVIADLSRYQSYSRTITIQYHWGEADTGTVSAQVRADGGWLRCDATLPGGMEEHSIVGDGALWLWYDDREGYVHLPAAEGQGDLMQYIPTHEDVLALPPGSILSAGYEERGGLPCIRVEVAREELGYRERYWVSVDSGLLVCAETEKEERVVYAMSSYEVSSPMTDSGAFVLPDGTALHVPGREPLTPPPDPEGALAPG